MTAQPRIELWDIEDVPADVAAAAAAAALAKLDELAVSPLEARLAMFALEAMDDGGGFDLVDVDATDLPPDCEKWSVNQTHLDAHFAAVDAGSAVIQQLFPARERGTIAIGVPLPALDQWKDSGADVTKAERAQ